MPGPLLVLRAVKQRLNSFSWHVRGWFGGRDSKTCLVRRVSRFQKWRVRDWGTRLFQREKNYVQKTAELLRPSRLSEAHWAGARQEKRRKVFFQTTFGVSERSRMKLTAFLKRQMTGPSILRPSRLQPGRIGIDERLIRNK